MSGMFGAKQGSPVPIVNPADTQNRLNDALARRLQGGGSNADLTSAMPAATGAARLPTLTGLN
jgi:hypothetical protein